MKFRLAAMKTYIFIFFIIISVNAHSESSKILCELDGDFSVTYKDIKKRISLKELIFLKI